jgi:hypothetical protein
MTEVKFTKATGGHRVGDRLNTSPGAAAYLIEAGVAEPHETPEKPAPKAASGRTKAGVGGDSPAKAPSTAG